MPWNAPRRARVLSLVALVGAAGGCTDSGRDATAVVQPAVGHAARNQVMHDFMKTQVQRKGRPSAFLIAPHPNLERPR
ncbi:MAG: hypothetical protein P4L84_04935 [Isosphaeraceae bacterium]|nr:hypothetical protein [Isosphaeraceae bacterium]